MGAEALAGYASWLGLEVGAFAQCLDGAAHAETIETDASEANRVRITGTLTSVIGKSEDDVVNGRHVVGALGLNVFQSGIDRLLPGST